MTKATPFELHPRLAADTIHLGNFQLSRLLLMNEQRYPWFILVPERPGITEIHQLSIYERYLLQDESVWLSEFLSSYYGGKLNIAAIGNLVSQLHLHHIVRKPEDPAWPGTVWGKFDPLPYTNDQQIVIYETVRQAELKHFRPAQKPA